MHSYLLEQHLPFTELCLRSGWGRRQFGISGDHIISFQGPINAGEVHCAHMLHIVIEHFGMSREMIVCQSRIFQYILAQVLGVDFLVVEGRVFYMDMPFSISKIRHTKQSAKCHVGIPISPLFDNGIGLSHFDIGIPELASTLHQQYCLEIEVQSR